MVRSELASFFYAMLLVLLLLLTGWLNRYRYFGNDVRTNRFTGSVEIRIVEDDARSGWQQVLDRSQYLPPGAGLFHPLDRNPQKPGVRAHDLAEE